MRAEDIRAFVARPRAPVERLKREYWASRAQDDGEGAIPLGHVLLEHAQQADPAYPSAAGRREDYEHHVWLKLLVDRARPAFQSR